MEQADQLNGTIQELMKMTVGRAYLVAHLLTFYGVKTGYARFFKRFPTLLKRFQNVLLIPVVPLKDINSLRSDLVAQGEALIHIYVDETTTHLFDEQVSILLEKAAECVRHRPKYEYTKEAVNRRFQRLRHDHPQTCEMIRQLVKEFRSRGEHEDLDDFVDRRAIELWYEEARDKLDEVP